MKRKECNNSKPNVNMDVAKEINPNVKNINKQCNANSQKCGSSDNFDCADSCSDSFEKK